MLQQTNTARIIFFISLFTGLLKGMQLFIQVERVRSFIVHFMHNERPDPACFFILCTMKDLTPLVFCFKQRFINISYWQGTAQSSFFSIICALFIPHNTEISNNHTNNQGQTGTSRNCSPTYFCFGHQKHNLRKLWLIPFALSLSKGMMANFMILQYYWQMLRQAHHER